MSSAVSWLRPGWNVQEVHGGPDITAPATTRFTAGTDRLDRTGIATDAASPSSVAQVGAHVHIELDGGGDPYLAWTTLAGLAGHDVPL